MLLQTNSYLVPRDALEEHDALMRRFRRCFSRLGVGPGEFEVYRQTDASFSDTHRGSVRCVQMIRFRDEQHHQRVRVAEGADDEARELVSALCRLVDLPAQQRSGQFGGNYYTSAADGKQT